MPYMATLTPQTTPTDRHIWQSHGESGIHFQGVPAVRDVGRPTEPKLVSAVVRLVRFRRVGGWRGPVSSLYALPRRDPGPSYGGVGP